MSSSSPQPASSPYLNRSRRKADGTGAARLVGKDGKPQACNSPISEGRNEICFVIHRGASHFHGFYEPQRGMTTYRNFTHSGRPTHISEKLLAYI